MGPFDSRPAEVVGTLLGWLVAPVFALTSALRRARTFHPTGHVFAADVTPVDGVQLGERLRGPALVRFSSALWKGDREWIDALGCALRFRRTDEPTPEASEGDQDVLFATIRRPWTTLLAPLTTHVHDFLANDYYAVSPFRVPGFGTGYLRLRPLRASSGAAGATRAERLYDAVARREVNLQLEVRRAWQRRWTAVATVHVRAPLDIDQDRLRFSPFRDGRGIVPRGLVHGLRRGVYALSQRARPGD